MWQTLKKQFESTDSLVSLALGLAVVLVIGLTIINYVKSKTQVATSTVKQEQSPTAQGPLPTKYVVKAGDTLWSIAENYYKSGYNWVDVAKANSLADANLIDVGQTLIIPAAAPIVVQGEISSAATSIAPKDKTYTVVRGDDLWNIAVKEYGNGYRWADIAKANSLANPGLIHAGNVLQMP